jgi:hypothetical protein
MNASTVNARVLRGREHTSAKDMNVALDDYEEEID